jgi:hypothetical protein
MKMNARTILLAISLACLIGLGTYIVYQNFFGPPSPPPTGSGNHSVGGDY